MSQIEHVHRLELSAMGAMASALAALPDDHSRQRVLRWILEHFPAGAALDRERVRLPRFETLADLFAAAAPLKEREKALVSAYWFQQQSPSGSFTAQEVNKGLSDLGHRIVNITGALGDLMDRRPKLVAQIEKAGRTRQARKTYRITPEGLRAVRQMLES